MTDQPVLIAPSILAADFARLGEQVAAAESAGADMIHIDVMDGRFVPNLSFGALIVEAARRSTRLPLDVHLMIVEPDTLLDSFAEAGASAITVHWEACVHLHRTLQRIKAHGLRAGVALNPHTPASFLSEVLPMIDLVQVMTVNPGYGGQQFLPEVMPKLSALRRMSEASGQRLDLSVDGGINAETTPRAVSAGANMLVAGSAVFSARFSVAEGIQRLRAAAAQAGNRTA